MKIVTVANGSLSMYIQPESELDKMILSELFKGPIDSKTHATVQVGGKSMVDVVEITSASTKTQQ